MFCDEPRVVLISSSSYTANNEFLIGALTGGSLDIFWGPADVQQPARGWSWSAFQSDFSFDIDANADALREVVRL